MDLLASHSLMNMEDALQTQIFETLLFLENWPSLPSFLVIQLHLCFWFFNVDQNNDSLNRQAPPVLSHIPEWILHDFPLLATWKCPQRDCQAKIVFVDVSLASIIQYLLFLKSLWLLAFYFFKLCIALTSSVVINKATSLSVQ